MFQHVLYDTPIVRKTFKFGKQRLVLDNCFHWLKDVRRNSITAVVTDPPYGLVEFTPTNQRKMRSGRGGIWRLPPAFDGYARKALPRYTILSETDRQRLGQFYRELGRVLFPALKPGAHIAIAGTPLLSPLMSHALEASGFERRGEIVRLVRTFRGGDRPKGAEEEFPDVCTLPRSCWETWGLYRKPLEGTMAENLRKYKTGGLRRLSDERPFLDVIASGITPEEERELALHPSLKPQQFLRHLIRALLPLGKGVVLDPFCGSGSTLAACEFLRVPGVGVEIDAHYFDLAKRAIPALAKLKASPIELLHKWFPAS